MAGREQAADTFAKQLRRALLGPGCYYVVGHGIDDDVIADAFRASGEFHSLPAAEKRAITVNDERLGYVAANAYVSRSAEGVQHPNLVEAFFARRDAAARGGQIGEHRNQWPRALPHFRSRVVAYCDAVEALCLALLPAYALALGAARDFFAAAFERPQYMVRLSRYPCVSAAQPGQFGLAPHVDPSFMVLLAQDELEGLSVEGPDGWVDAPVIDGALFVNSGDILHRWTNGRAVAPRHAVTNRSRQHARYVIPFFFDPSLDYRMTCPASCVEPGRQLRYEPTTFREYMDWYNHR